MSNKKVIGKNKFQESWLGKEVYKAWLEKGLTEELSCARKRYV